MESRNASTVAWAALIVALLALILAWLAYSQNSTLMNDSSDIPLMEIQNPESITVEDIETVAPQQNEEAIAEVGEEEALTGDEDNITE
jgi:hypothetical protein